jgi:hypothetical protein
MENIPRCFIERDHVTWMSKYGVRYFGIITGYDNARTVRLRHVEHNSICINGHVYYRPIFTKLGNRVSVEDVNKLDLCLHDEMFFVQ